MSSISLSNFFISFSEFEILDLHSEMICFLESLGILTGHSSLLIGQIFS
jgi:hypothetical protein